MNLSVYKWGWFKAAMSRAIWGWVGRETPAGGFTPRAAVSAAVFKAAPVIEKGVSVKEGGRMRATRRPPSAGLIQNMNAPASRVSLPESDATLSRAGANGHKRAGAGAKTVKLGQRQKRTGMAKVVNKTKKP